MICLINKFKLKDIEKRIIELYPSEESAVREGIYANIINSLVRKDVVDSSLSILVEKIITKEGDCYVLVSGLSKDDVSNRQKYGIEFGDWDEWLGMDIAAATLKQYLELDIVVHCLNEMTFISYDENEVNNVMDDLNECVNDIKKGSENILALQD